MYTRVAAVTRKVRRFSGGVYARGLYVVWCPKYRHPLLGGPVTSRVDEPIRVKAGEPGWEIVALEVMPDHVHLFVKHDPKSSASHVANQFKAAAFGAVSARTVDRYIDTQWERPWCKGDRP